MNVLVVSLPLVLKECGPFSQCQSLDNPRLMTSYLFTVHLLSLFNLFVLNTHWFRGDHERLNMWNRLLSLATGYSSRDSKSLAVGLPGYLWPCHVKDSFLYQKLVKCFCIYESWHMPLDKNKL